MWLFLLLIMAKDIERFIEQFNTAWITGDIEQLEPILDENVVFVLPDFKAELQGKERCLQTIRDYVDNTQTREFRVTGKSIRVWPECAMVTVDYYIEYSIQGNSYSENGKEVWTLLNRSGVWKMAWRALVLYEKL